MRFAETVLIAWIEQLSERAQVSILAVLDVLPYFGTAFHGVIRAKITRDLEECKMLAYSSGIDDAVRSALALHTDGRWEAIRIGIITILPPGSMVARVDVHDGSQTGVSLITNSANKTV